MSDEGWMNADNELPSMVQIGQMCQLQQLIIDDQYSQKHIVN